MSQSFVNKDIELNSFTLGFFVLKCHSSVLHSEIVDNSFERKIAVLLEAIFSGRGNGFLWLFVCLKDEHFGSPYTKTLGLKWFVICATDFSQPMIYCSTAHRGWKSIFNYFQFCFLLARSMYAFVCYKIHEKQWSWNCRVSR